jgi:cell division protein ZipA
MGALQWALLILGVAAVVAVYFYSRRERKDGERVEPQMSAPKLAGAPDRQMDIFAGGGSKFDEFGVGKPRRVGGGAGGEGEETTPGSGERKVSEKIIALLIAEREGTHIFGEQLHAALQAQGLEFGDRQIYHRLDRSSGGSGRTVFSVASLLKPGYLNPSEAKGFTTPGLTVFMVLPGPVHPVTAFQDMLTTTQALARALNANVYDGKRQPLTTDLAHTLQLEVETFARESLH